MILTFGDERLPDRFWDKVEPIETGCWIWIGAGDGRDYGLFHWGDRQYRAHRVAYAELAGPIPQGHVLDHLCRTRPCVHPLHLDPVTNQVNVLRGTGPTAAHARKTHCPRGHPLSGDNLYEWGGGRYCRTCRRERSRGQLCS